jgi:hypothetical protein
MESGFSSTNMPHTGSVAIVYTSHLSYIISDVYNCKIASMGEIHYVVVLYPLRKSALGEGPEALTVGLGFVYPITVV